MKVSDFGLASLQSSWKPVSPVSIANVKLW